MATRHVNSTGSNTSPYDTWAKAATTWATAVSGSAAGDIFVADSAFTTLPAGLTLAFPGTSANPNLIISGTPGVTSGLTAYVAGAVIGTSNTTGSITGCFRAKGIKFQASSGSSFPFGFATTSADSQVFDLCAFEFGSGGSSSFDFGATSGSISSRAVLNGCTFKYGAAGQQVNISYTVEINGGSLAAGGTSPTTMFNLSAYQRGCDLTVQGYSFNNASAGVNICSIAGGSAVAVFRDCKTPSSWSGLYNTASLLSGSHLEFYGLTAANRLHISDYTYTLDSEFAIYVTGTVFNEHSTPGSLKVVTTANCSKANAAKLPVFGQLVLGSASTLTSTIEIARDGSATAYTDAEIWQETEYLDPNTTGGGVMTDDMCDLLTFINSGGTAQASSSATWTGLGGTNNKMKLQVSVNPNVDGYVLARVVAAVPSATFYTHPIPTIA